MMLEYLLFFFTDINTGYFVSYYGIKKTTNGGSNWNLNFNNLYMNSIYFTDANTGYAVGGVWGNDAIIKTTNGGSTWVAQNSETSQILESVYFITSDIGYAVGATQSLVNGNKILKIINEELNSINKEKISEDIKFWKKYQSFQSNSLGNIFEREWLSRPFEYSFLDSIISLYPKSEFADNAEWIIKQFSNAFRNEEGGIPSFNIKELEFYRHFLSKYPNSELLPEILKDMAYVYTYIGDSIEQRIQNIDTAQFIYIRLQKDYPEFSKKENIEIYNDLKENLLKGNLGWKFLIKTKKLSYTKNEPIEIEFILKNKTKYKRTLEFYDGVPNFYIRVLGENEFIEIPKNMDFIKKAIEVEPMGTYHEKWDIKKMIKIEFNDKPGYIKIGNTDGLRIAGTFRFSNSEPFSTDEISIIIHE